MERHYPKELNLLETLLERRIPTPSSLRQVARGEREGDHQAAIHLPQLSRLMPYGASVVAAPHIPCIYRSHRQLDHMTNTVVLILLLSNVVSLYMW